MTEKEIIEKMVDEFVCDLGCPCNCCLESAGGIMLDGEYEKYKKYDGKKLVDGTVFNLKEMVEETEDGLRFKQDKNGVCILVKDGRCLFQSTFGRNVLHYECREYPRWTMHYKSHVEKMLSPVCPRVTELFLKDNLYFWDYMTQVIEPDPDNLFEERRQIIMVLRDENTALSDALALLCSRYGIDHTCSAGISLSKEIEDILRHQLACTFFCELLQKGYDREYFEYTVPYCLSSGIKIYDYLCDIENLNRNNIAVHFNKACYNAIRK